MAGRKPAATQFMNDHPRILYVCGPFAGSVWGAGQQDHFALLRMLREVGCEVYLATYDLNTNAEQLARHTGLLGADHVGVFSLAPERCAWRCHLSSSLDPATRAFHALRHTPAFQDFVHRVHPDACVLMQSFLTPIQDFMSALGVPAIVRSVNFEPSHFLETMPWSKLLNPIGVAVFLAKYLSEHHSVTRAREVWCISPREEVQYAKWRKSEVTLLPLCSLPDLLTDPSKRFRARPPDGPVHLFYSGSSYSILPHLRGAEYLIKKIMPLLAAQAPGQFIAHLYGAKLPPDIQRLCHGNITYHGYVDDLEAELDRMDVCVAPVFTGKGMKQKIFEALAKGYPVVAPRSALGGYALTHGKDILIAKRPGEFVEAIMTLRDPVARERIGRAAHEFCKREFNKERFQRTIRATLLTFV